MENRTRTTTVGQLPTPESGTSRVPTVLTKVVWLLWALSCGALAVRLRTGDGWEIAGLANVDGLTVVMWVTVAFFSGIVHSYSRRYMAGRPTIDRFFGGVFAFTLVVMVLVAADSFLLFGAAWLAMGLVMADLIGHVEGWTQAQAAASIARRYFLASSASLAVALATLWWHTGATTVSGVASAVETPSSTVVLFAAGALLLAAMVQSALLPFHTWLLSSMTAPTPASALMHAGFVNAGGVLLARFAPVVTVDSGFMLLIVLVGAASALGGKLLKTVQTDVKGTLGCSTVGQMGFMIMQAGLGFFGAAITHLVLHGFYKAYQFLASGSRVAHKSPANAKPTGSIGAAGVAVIAVTALAAGGLFAALTGKGTGLDSGLLLALLVVLTVLHAAREIVTRAALPAAVRYGAVPLVALPALAVYAAVYRVIDGLLAGLPAVGQSAALTPAHGLVAVAFLVAYLAIERGVYERSHRLYVALLNATRPPTETLLTSTEEYDEY
ncbi:oxidoreductase [Natronomonas sp. F2-12]|jgi:NAD(P)H-quinone oxidoreductase subunit 5|uniref:Oxidoreductase n=1 Tax=Natronomonas aquatica TaxID=2841590 RepID=A0A9R1CV85_9EURY|nr:proton-conducting transporter membrane subunit [Natronomonas aquatica]MCQ4334490.1 oxidoreductase [Natronomonas aquatica]